MPLPYLPVEQIEPAFNRLMEVAEGVGGPVLRVCEYISRTWIHGSVWRPLNWCVFKRRCARTTTWKVTIIQLALLIYK
ncbi:hypothetical protein DPMN_041564 [Dreissena polymorpha]|uniref:Uncharacterized protein n=1 Tax=Dreissena polymorpha TaxID=45954 RepID=A0A9D4CX58_DREPO|nr:hypothetical protein DPMN_041564 [Dreissena polymorpha]